VSYLVWCEYHKVTHGHCPYECEHPQPIELADGRLVCGKHLMDDGEAVEMVPCDC
jgi:hypothetical protein